MMNTEILKIKGDWQEVVDDCRSTVGKPPLGREPSTEFRRKILIAEHSPIRSMSVMLGISPTSVTKSKQRLKARFGGNSPEDTVKTL